MLRSNGVSSSPSELVLTTRDCVIISNDSGGGEQDTTMTDEKWQQSVPTQRKEMTADTSPSSSTSSGASIAKSPDVEAAYVVREQHLQVPTTPTRSPQNRAQSPVISAFIDQRLESLRSEYRDLDTLKEFAEEGEGDSKVSLDSSCSYQDKEEAYTLARLQKAGAEFQIFAGLLEVLGAEEEEEGVDDVESQIAHTGLTQTQTQTTQSQGAGGEFYF